MINAILTVSRAYGSVVDQILVTVILTTACSAVNLYCQRCYAKHAALLPQKRCMGYGIFSS